ERVVKPADEKRQVGIDDALIGRQRQRRAAALGRIEEVVGGVAAEPDREADERELLLPTFVLLHDAALEGDAGRAAIVIAERPLDPAGAAELGARIAIGLVMYGPRLEDEILFGRQEIRLAELGE